MAQQNINIGSSANKGDGDPIRTAFTKVNTNFTELYNRVVVAEGQLGIDNVGGATIQQSIIGSVFADDSTLLIDGANGSIPAANITGTLPALDGSALTNLPAQAFASITGKPTTLAGYGITDATSNNNPAFTGAVDFTGATSIDFNTVTINNLEFADISSKPTTLAGYGITDAATLNNMAPTGAVDFTGATSVDFTGATITGTSFLTSYTETDPVVGAITGLVKSDGAGNISAAVAGTDYLTTVAFADLTGKPTTIAGYGITDAFDGAFGSLSGTPTTLAGYGITDALASGGALTGSSLDTNTIQTSSGNLAISADNYVQINSDNNGQIEIGTASGIGNVLIGNESNGTQISIQGEVFIEERARFFKGAEEKFATLTGQVGTVDHDCSNGHVFYHTGATGAITANFTNLGLTAEYATNLTVIINQGATAYEVNAVQIGGAVQTIEWQGGSAPTGTANGIDSFSFTILNDGGSYVVLGQMVDFT